MNDKQARQAPANVKQPRLAVFGAGMSGILCGIKLQEAGFQDFTIYEKAESLGGTWRDNTYPGLTCDVPSLLYAYSFELNPDWSSRFAPGPEIRAYFERVAHKHALDARMRLGQEVTRCEFRHGRWHLETKQGVTDVVDFVLCATGLLHHPKQPDIAGLSEFAGRAFHSARWPQDLQLEGQRVGIIGNGSTGVQLLPALVDGAAHATMFQRTPQWILPMENAPFTDEERKAFREQPGLLAERYATITESWSNTIAKALVGENPEALQQIQAACQQHLEGKVRDPELRRKLTPDHQAGCKRLVNSEGYYEAIQRPNARLVTEPIARVEPAGVRTTDGELHELDLLVMATGFRAHDFMAPMQVIGQDGRELAAQWDGAPRAHRCISVPGFPNFFMMLGPHCPVGNFSLITIAELQADYILKLIELRRSEGVKTIAPKPEAERRFNAELAEASQGTVWASGCKSWYLDKFGRPANWPWGFEKFQQDMREPDLQEYQLER